MNALILKALTWGPMHGYALSKWILQASEDTLRVEEGVLYPALHKLEREKWLRAEWGVNDTGRRAKFYRGVEIERADAAIEIDEGRARKCGNVTEQDNRDEDCWADFLAHDGNSLNECG